MLFILLLLCSSLTHGCIPTSPAAMPPIPCGSCDPSLVTVSNNFMSDKNSIVNGCLTRTLICKAPINYVSGSIIAGPATLALTCNAANSAWMYNGAVITKATCSRCQDCATGLMTKTMNPGTTWVNPESTSIVNGCSVRRITCVGPPPPGMCMYISINIGSSNVVDATLAAGMLIMDLTCNTAGTSWRFQNPSLGGGPYPVYTVQCMTVPTATCMIGG